MKIKKSTAYIAGLAVVIGLVALLGFTAWNQNVLPALGTLSQYSLYFILGFAFFAGVVSFFSPCGLALLPAFLSYNLALAPDSSEKTVPKTRFLKIGLFSGLGIMSFFLLLGGLFSLLGAALGPFIQFFQYLIALLLILFGFVLFRQIAFPVPGIQGWKARLHEHAMKQTGYKGFYVFGFAYGLDIIGCLFPLISILIFIPLATGDLTTGLSAFLSYSVAVALMLSVFSYSMSYSKRNLLPDVLNTGEKIKKLTGAGLMVGGIALLFYYANYGMLIG